MLTRRTDSARARLALRLTGLLAVLSGVIGLHGLASQCVGGMAEMPHAAITAASFPLSSPDLIPIEVSGPLDPILAPVQGAAASVSALGTEGMNLMTGFCLALLVVGVGALSMLLRGSRVSPVPWPLPPVIGAIERSGRDPAPPLLTALSIQRC